MEDQYTDGPEEEVIENEEEAVEIYSKQAIFWFSVLFNPIFGGALLMQNLRDVGYKKEANQVIFFAIIYFIIPQTILSVIPINMVAYMLITVGLNVGAGFIFIDYFYPKYFPDNDYYPKSIWRVLFRCIAISIIFALLSQYLTPIIASKVK